MTWYIHLNLQSRKFLLIIILFEASALSVELFGRIYILLNGFIQMLADLYIL